MNKPLYTSKKWLSENNIDTSSCVAVDGWAFWDNNQEHIYLDIAACNEATARFQPAESEDLQAFISKLVTLRNEINMFVAHLQSRD